MLSILKLIHAVLGLSAFGAGVSVCIRMATGRPFRAWVRHFLRLSLVACAVGLILSIHHTGLTQLLTMLSVYASVFAVISWRKYSTSENWGPAIVLSTMCVLCLDTVIMSTHILKLLAACNLLRSAQADVPLVALMVTAVLLFVFFSTMALKGIHRHPSDSMMHKAAQ